MPMDVDSQSAAVADMAEAWPRIDALSGGTGAMRKAGKAFLPQFAAEPAEAYKIRLDAAVLFPAFAHTSEVLAAKPLSKAIGIKDVPPDIEALFEDIGGPGVTLHALAGTLMLECLRPGLVGVLVDMPPRPADVRTLADEQAAGLRPRFAVYKAGSILGWRCDEMGGLAQLRLMEEVCEPDGDWGEKAVRQVRVLTPGAWATYRKVMKDGKEVWALHTDGETTIKRIPFAFFYGIREGFGIGRPPLEHLAHQNVLHWQSSSDQQTLLRTARVPILFAKGLKEDEPIVIGAASLTRTTNHEASMEFVEHSGAAIEAGRQSLKDLEDQMRQTGAELLVQRPMTATATQTVSETEASRSILQRIAEGFEESLEECITLAGEWTGQKIAPNVTVYKDFGAAHISDNAVNTLLTAEEKGVVSTETAFKGLQRRDLVPQEITWEEEWARIAAQPPKTSAPAPAQQPKEDPNARSV